MGLEAYSTTPANNNSSPPNGAPEGMAPSGVNDCIRQVMADVRSYAEGAQWFNYGHTPTRVDNDTFTVATDLTTTYMVGRRLKLTGGSTGYCTITASSYSVPNTTVDVLMDSGNVPSPLTTVSVGILTSSSSSLPTIYTNALTAPAFITTGSTIPANGLYLPAANTVGIATNTTLRWSVNSTGVHTFVAPSSGDTVNIGVLSGSHAVVLSGSTTSSLLYLQNTSGADGRTTAEFVNNLTTSKTYTLGIDPSGGTSKAFELRDVTRGVTPVSVGTSGNVTINAPSSGTTLTVTGVANANASVVTSPNTAGQSFGFVSTAGTNSSDYAMLLQGAAGTNYFRVYGDGGVTVGTPTGTDKGAGTLNTAGNIYVNDVQVATQESGTFTCGYTGFSANPGTTVNYARTGNHVILRFPNSTGTSNGSTFVVTGIPAALQPATLQQVVAIGNLIDNGTISASPCVARVNPASSNLEFFPTAGLGGSWSVVGTKGFSGSITFSYTLV